VATRAQRIIASLTWVGLTPEEIADTLAEFGAPPDEALDRVLAAIRADRRRRSSAGTPSPSTSGRLRESGLRSDRDCGTFEVFTFGGLQALSGPLGGLTTG
jgi:hypothetical protein